MKERFVINLFGHIPLSVRRTLAFFIARLAYYISLKHRLITIHNLMRAFPYKSLKEIIRLAKESYVAFMIVVADFVDIPHLNKENLHKWISVEGLDNYTDACEEGKGVLIFSAHFGNWEIGNAALAIMTQPFVFVYRIFDNHLLEMIIEYVRNSYGNISLSKQKAMRPMIRSLKNGATINLLIDQNIAWYEGVFVDFFGRKACTTSGLALLALHTKAPVLPVFTRRLPNGRYLLEIGKKIDIINSGNRDADVLMNTQNFTRIIEEQIRKYPDQWFWVHQRWKTKLCQVRQKG
ncbi:MAG: lysophospholipid acyltransferase family protein [Deltaproteobacteria bacterium]|nr:lysophospholipid acyltransferase family protein [Deltaproteobacteria bacterium]